MNLLLWIAIVAMPPEPADLLPGYPLGLALEQFRDRAPPPGARAVCSHRGGPEWLRPDALAAQTGVVRCTFLGRGGRRAAVRLAGGVRGTADLFFFEARLYRIEAGAGARHRFALLRALGRGRGDPSETRERLGGELPGLSFDRSVYSWRDGSRQLVMTAPASAAEPIAVVQADSSVAQRVEAQRIRLMQPPRIM